MYWMAVDIDVHSNSKVLALADRLDTTPDEAVGLLVRLWAHAMRNSDRSGKLRHCSPAVLSEVLRKPKDKALAIMDMLMEIGLLDHEASGYSIHDWADRQAAWYVFKDKQEYNKDRNKAKRAKSKAISCNAGCTTIVQQLCPTVPNHTIPNLTVPNPTVPNNTQTEHEGGGEAPTPCAPAGAPSPVQIISETVNERTAENVITLYKELCPSLPGVSKLTEKRMRRALWHMQHTGMGAIHDAFAKAETTPFLTGENNRGWKASFDWLMAGDNLIKVLEGNFDHSGYSLDPTFDTNFKNSHTYTKEQFAAMKSGVFDLKNL